GPVEHITRLGQYHLAHVERDPSLVEQIKDTSGRAFQIRCRLHKDHTVNDNSRQIGGSAHSPSSEVCRKKSSRAFSTRASNSSSARPLSAKPSRVGARISLN